MLTSVVKLRATLVCRLDAKLFFSRLFKPRRVKRWVLWIIYEQFISLRNTHCLSCGVLEAHVLEADFGILT